MYWKKVMVKKKKKEYRDGITGCAFVIDAVSNGDNGENRQNQPRRRPSHLPISSLSLSLSLSSLKSQVSSQNSEQLRQYWQPFFLTCLYFSLFFLYWALDSTPAHSQIRTPPFYFYFFWNFDSTLCNYPLINMRENFKK